MSGLPGSEFDLSTPAGREAARLAGAVHPFTDEAGRTLADQSDLKPGEVRASAPLGLEARVRKLEARVRKLEAINRMWSESSRPAAEEANRKEARIMELEAQAAAYWSLTFSAIWAIEDPAYRLLVLRHASQIRLEYLAEFGRP